jgi:hypothetical protein
MNVPLLSFGPKSESLQKKSTNILSVFTKTVEELTTVNADAEVEANKKTEEIKVAQAELESLEKLREANTKVIEKINLILS